MKEKIIDIVNILEPELSELSLEIYKNPELGNEEFFACKLHIDLLKKHGFTIEENYLGVKTGFKATYDSGKPGLKIAYLSEYDALPGIGHGCGHNLLGATSTGSGIALKEVIDQIGGSVIVFGTPAEETSGAKITYSENGAFDDISIALIAHPSNRYEKSSTSMALEPIQFEFFGKTAHAAACPEEGINALDAAISTINNINALREHVLDTSRIHGVIIDGGKAANVVPDYAKVQYYVRSMKKTYNTKLLERVINCAKAGALATGTRLEITKYEFSYDNMVTNETLSDVFTDTLFDVAGIKPCDTPRGMGSIDTGNVSQICPTIHPYFDITQNNENIIAHSIEMANSTITDYAKEQMKNTISTLVMTAIKVMNDKGLYEKIKAEFENTEK